MSLRYGAMIVSLMSSCLASAQTQNFIDSGVHQVAPLYQVKNQYLATLKQIRESAMEQQRVDGGRLTPEHVEKFDKKIADATRAYRNSSH